MASGYLDYIRDVETEKLNFLKDSPFLIESDLIVQPDGITVTAEGQTKIDKVNKDRAEAEEAGLKYVLPVAKVSVIELKAKSKKQQKEADRLAKELAQAEADEAVENEVLPEPFKVDSSNPTKK